MQLIPATVSDGLGSGSQLTEMLMPTSNETGTYSTEVLLLPFSTETRMPTHTTTDLSTSPETGTSTMGTGTSENPFPTETGMPTHITTDLSTSSERGTSTTEITSLSGITLNLIIALAAIVFISLVVLLLIICIAVYKCSRKSGGWPCCFSTVLSMKVTAVSA